jgi:regulatory protein YycI of two-component signal transduction system YycFG
MFTHIIYIIVILIQCVCTILIHYFNNKERAIAKEKYDAMESLKSQYRHEKQNMERELQNYTDKEVLQASKSKLEETGDGKKRMLMV